jgi:hypothetical protein
MHMQFMMLHVSFFFVLTTTFEHPPFALIFSSPGLKTVLFYERLECRASTLDLFACAAASADDDSHRKRRRVEVTYTHANS